MTIALYDQVNTNTAKFRWMLANLSPMQDQNIVKLQVKILW